MIPSLTNQSRSTGSTKVSPIPGKQKEPCLYAVQAGQGRGHPREAPGGARSSAPGDRHRPGHYSDRRDPVSVRHRALDFGRGGLSVASSKLGKPRYRVVRCRAAPLGSCASTPRMWGWTDILNVLGEISHSPRMWGAPVSGVASLLARASSGRGSAVSAAPPFFCACVAPVRVAAGSPNPGKRGV